MTVSPFAEMMERATAESYYAHGPVPATQIERVAHELRYEAVDLLARGYELRANAALVLADRLDETAEIARLLSAHRRAVAA